LIIIGAAMMPSTVTAADDAGRHGEDRRGQDHSEVERPTDRREQVAQGPEQPFHQSGLLGHEAHEDEEGNRRENLVLHRPPDLEISKIEGQLDAQPDRAEYQAQEEQGERDREANEDDCDHAEQHDQAQDLIAGHSSSFS
jgi:hypothetical protein